MNTRIILPLLITLLMPSQRALAGEALPYPIVDTGQTSCYDNHTQIPAPHSGGVFYGQDAQYKGNQPAYQKNNDGTVTDLNTRLMWQGDPGEKKTYAQAVAGASECRIGGYDDWRLPTIKDLYSLIQFTGMDPNPMSRDTSRNKPFIDTHYFHFQYGTQADGDRIIDSQWATSTLYAGKVMNGQQAMFGVNFADGRIKGYPAGQDPRGQTKKYYVIYVRGNQDYGKNDFMDNGDGTITDHATGLTWMQVDSAALKAGSRNDGKMNWQEALSWAETLHYANHDDWRLPNAKELQSIVDYSRSPDTTHSAAIDPILKSTPIENEGKNRDFGMYWTSTTQLNFRGADAAVYVAFGRALGFMGPPDNPDAPKRLLDVHGAGAQRSDPKFGNASDFPIGRGPQGDVIRVHNLVRCVRG